MAIKSIETIGNGITGKALVTFEDRSGFTSQEVIDREDLTQIAAALNLIPVQRTHTWPPAEDRTRIGNTPTCEDCGKPQDHCICDNEQTTDWAPDYNIENGIPGR